MPTSNGAQNDTIQFGTFLLQEQIFGVNILRMREIIRPIEITKVPKAASFIEGVINLRGCVIPIVSLRARFGMPVKPFDKETRIINIEVQNTVIGFLVDSIGRVHRLPADAVEPTPAVVASVDSEYIAGVAQMDENMLIVLDVDKLISTDVLESIASL